LPSGSEMEHEAGADTPFRMPDRSRRRRRMLHTRIATLSVAGAATVGLMTGMGQLNAEANHAAAAVPAISAVAVTSSDEYEQAPAGLAFAVRTGPPASAGTRPTVSGPASATRTLPAGVVEPASAFSVSTTSSIVPEVTSGPAAAAPTTAPPVPAAPTTPTAAPPTTGAPLATAPPSVPPITAPPSTAPPTTDVS
jgi:hypothetical protein